MSNDLFKDLTFTVYSSTFEKSTKDGRRLIRGYASTSGLDLEREIISRKALEKAKNDLLKNHTVFIEHNHSPLMACGKVVDCILDDKGLLITVELSKAKFVDDIFILCEENILNSFSIGGIVIDGHDERGEDGKSYHVIDEILILEVSIVGIPCNQEAKFSVCKSFNSAIAEQIKQKEESQKMAKQDKPEVLKSEAPHASLEATQEPLKVEEPKEVATSPVSTETKEVVAKDVEPEVKKEETSLDVGTTGEKGNIGDSGEVIETKPAEVALEAPKEEIKKEEVIEAPKVSEEAPKETVEKAKVDETPSEENPNPGLVVEDADAEKSTDEKILDALALIIEKLSSLDKKEVTEKKEEEVVEPKKEEKSQEVITEKNVEETTVEKKEEVEVEKVEKTLEKVEEVPTRKSLAIVVPAPYEEEETETNPKEDERKKSLGWGKLIFGK